MFSQSRKVVDRWVGNEPIKLHGGVIDTLSYTFRVEGESLSREQVQSALDVIARYDLIWEKISPKIEGKFNSASLNSRLLLYMPARVGNDEFEFMLGYEFIANDSILSAFFAFNEFELAYEHVDSH